MVGGRHLEVAGGEDGPGLGLRHAAGKGPGGLQG